MQGVDIKDVLIYWYDFIIMQAVNIYNAYENIRQLQKHDT